LVDTKKEAREAREARNRALRLREQLLRDDGVEEEDERRARKEEGDRWKTHYEKVMVEDARRLRR
jgi:hypothetical protein